MGRLPKRTRGLKPVPLEAIFIRVPVEVKRMLLHKCRLRHCTMNRYIQKALKDKWAAEGLLIRWRNPKTRSEQTPERANAVTVCLQNIHEEQMELIRKLHKRRKPIVIDGVELKSEPEVFCQHCGKQISTSTKTPRS